MADPRNMQEFGEQLFGARTEPQQPDRAEVAARHGIPHLAAELVGDTKAEVEADAAAKAAIISTQGGELHYPQAEPEPEQVDEVQRLIALGEQAKAKRQAEQPEPLHPDATIIDVLSAAPAAKRAAHRALIDAAHGTEEDQ